MITVIIVLHYLIFLRHTYMTDHAGPRLCESHPWTKFWPPPIEVINPVLATEEWFWRPIPFLKEQTKINSSVWNKTVPWTISNNFCFILFPCLLINIIFFDLTKNGRQNRFLGAKTAPWVPKLGYFDGRVPKVSSWVTLTTSGAGVVRHIDLEKNSLREGVKKSTGSMGWGIRGGDLHLSSGYGLLSPK